MNILVLTPLVPYPPHDGDKLRLYHFLRHLRSRGHVLDLFGVTRVNGEAEGVRQLGNLCRTVHFERVTDLDLVFNLLGGSLLGRSLNLASHFSPSLRDRLRSYWSSPAGKEVDVVLAHRLRMAPAAFEGNPGKPVVLDLTDCLAAYTEQVRDQEGFPLSRRILAWWDHWFLKREETEWGERAAKTLVISEADARALQANWLWADKIEVLPNGVELSGLTRRTQRPAAYGKDRPVVCFLGNMGYPPNEDAALWFLDRVWPRVREVFPDALFAAVGGRPRRVLRRRRDGDAILVTGPVPEVDPYLDHATLTVAPLRVASGMQNKVVRSLDRGIPVVASPQALAWAPETLRDCVASAQGADRFAREVLSVLQAPRKAKALAMRGKRRVRKIFRWEASGAQLERILKESAKGGRS